jgi:(p)ppGpp synthase/HD superfamily hydrolase
MVLSFASDMFLTPNIEQAIKRATSLHDGQKRKVSGVPYIVHPYAVAFLLAHYTDDEDVIIAGLLHDVLEDVPGYTEDDLRAEFGARVTAIVKEMTEDYTEAEKEDQSLRKHNWKERKEKYLQNLSDDSREALLITTADKIHNIRSLIDDYGVHGEATWERLGNKERIFWFYGEAVRIISERLDHPLAEELRKTLDEAKKSTFVLTKS